MINLMGCLTFMELLSRANFSQVLKTLLIGILIDLFFKACQALDGLFNSTQQKYLIFKLIFKEEFEIFGGSSRRSIKILEF